MRKLVPLALVLLAACNSPSAATRATTSRTAGPPIPLPTVATVTTTTLPLTAKTGGNAVDVEQLSGSWRVVAGGTKPFADFDVVTFLSSGTYLVKGRTGGMWTLSAGRLSVTTVAGAAITYTVLFEEGHLRLVGPADQDMILTRV